MKARCLSRLPKGNGPFLIYGLLETELQALDTEPSWHVCERSGAQWHVTGSCGYSAWIETPIAWAKLPTVTC